MLREDTRALIEAFNASASTPDPDEPNDDDRGPPPAATGPRKTYQQDWPAYDYAKTNEDVFFKRLLAELLLIAVEEPPARTGAGRKGFSRRDKLFAMCIKAYYKSDLRKAESMLKELRNLGLIAKVPCYRTIDGAFNDTSLNPILDHLILVTALPLVHLEMTAAIDSTGMSMYKYECWHEHKWGKETGKMQLWRKLHVATGTKTNIVITAEVTEMNVADIKMLPTLLRDTPIFKDMKEVVADKAYNSRDMFNLIGSMGLIPFIPYKSNTVVKARGSPLWKEMYEFFLHAPDDFLEVYHRRSNVESCFSSLKKRYGESLWTKNFIANSNEIKTRVLCHNLCVLIQEASERGINLDFVACEKMIHPVKKSN